MKNRLIRGYKRFAIVASVFLGLLAFGSLLYERSVMILWEETFLGDPKDILLRFGVSLAVGVGLYLILRAILWVISGFMKDEKEGD